MADSWKFTTTSRKRRSSRISSQNDTCKRHFDEEFYSPYFKSCQKTTCTTDLPSLLSKKVKTSDDLKNSSKAESEQGQSSHLSRSFYNHYAADLAKCLLGKRLYRTLEDGEILSGRIVETEGYLGVTDKACHSFGGKQTSRTEAMYMDPGTAYIYFIYGMHFCLNISSKDIGGAVLIRALEPIQGIQRMSKLRGQKKNVSAKALKTKDLCNGPSKLCQAMGITKAALNKEDMVSSKILWIEDDPDEEKDPSIVTSTRIGVNSYGPEAAKMPLRFYIHGNECVSVRDKSAEILMGQT